MEWGKDCTSDANTGPPPSLLNVGGLHVCHLSGVAAAGFLPLCDFGFVFNIWYDYVFGQEVIMDLTPLCHLSPKASWSIKKNFFSFF